MIRYLIIGEHPDPFVSRVYLRPRSDDCAETYLEYLHEMGYTTELYKIYENGEKVYIG